MNADYLNFYLILIDVSHPAPGSNEQLCELGGQRLADGVRRRHVELVRKSAVMVPRLLNLRRAVPLRRVGGRSEPDDPRPPPVLVQLLLPALNGEELSGLRCLVRPFPTRRGEGYF